MESKHWRVSVVEPIGVRAGILNFFIASVVMQIGVARSITEYSEYGVVARNFQNAMVQDPIKAWPSNRKIDGWTDGWIFLSSIRESAAGPYSAT